MRLPFFMAAAVTENLSECLSLRVRLEEDQGNRLTRRRWRISSRAAMSLVAEQRCGTHLPASDDSATTINFGQFIRNRLRDFEEVARCSGSEPKTSLHRVHSGQFPPLPLYYCLKITRTFPGLAGTKIVDVVWNRRPEAEGLSRSR
jgi:hypothetical protein